MRMRCSAILISTILLGACGDDGGVSEASETATETATGTDAADEVGTSDASTSTSTTSDDTTTTTTTTTDTDAGCPIGSENCPCTGGGGCDPGLMCVDGICTPPAPDTTGPDTSTTDPTTTDTTTTDTGGACNMDVSFEILAVDATSADGWDPFMSMIGEGMIMAWDNQTQDATISWDLDIPCDDTWHIWVRGFDQGSADSYFAMVDGGPNPPPIFEVECTQAPQQGEYVWNELNYRDPADGACTYTFDPWTQDWAAGIHQFTLMYRESAAVSRIWVTNTDLTPP